MNVRHIVTIIAGMCVGALAGGLFMYVTKDSANKPTNGYSHTQMMMDESGAHMDMMRQMMVTSERAFIERMIPHHQEAINTAREVLARGGTTPAIRELMESIITAQTAEIESMRTWYKAWYGTPYTDTGEYEPMMRELAELEGPALDRAFLEDMIPHHMGAIMMARSIQPHIEHEEIAALTEDIVRTQSAEIEIMQNLLSKR